MKRLLAIVVTSLTMLSCNEGAEGFDAEAGSSVAISVSGSTAISTTGYLLASVTVRGSGGALANGIQVRLGCENCDLMGVSEGRIIDLTDLSLLELTPNPDLVKTNEDGRYDFYVRVAPPSSLGKSSYTAIVSANIGVAATTAGIGVSQF